MAEYLIQEETLNQIADAIRAKTGEEGEMTPVEMPKKIESIEGVWEKMQKGTLTEWVDNNITNLECGGFQNCSSLNTVTCENLIKIYVPSAFDRCINLKNISLPLLQEISGDYTFHRTSVAELTLPSVTIIRGNNTFAISSLQYLEIPQLITAPFGLCQSCTSLSTLLLPSVQTLQGYLCDNSLISEIILPELLKMESTGYNFRNCQQLIKADFPKLQKISSTYNFQGCTALTTLILRNESSVVTLSNINNFANSGITNSTGYIYVPSVLIEEYKSATNWSTYATQFRALEDYTVDGTITGELDEAKIAEAAE